MQGFLITSTSPPNIICIQPMFLLYDHIHAKGATVIKLTRSHIESQLLLSTKLPSSENKKLYSPKSLCQHSSCESAYELSKF